MKEQVRIFSVNTHAFYTEEEKIKYDRLSKLRDEKRILLEWLKLTYISNDYSDSYSEYSEKRKQYTESKNKKESIYYDYFKSIANTIVVSYKKQSENKMTNEAWNTIHKNEVTFRGKEFKEYCNQNAEYKANAEAIVLLNVELQDIINKKDTARELPRQALYSVDAEGVEYEKIYRQISLFTSLLTDMLGLKTGELYEDMLVIKSKNSRMMEQLVKKGFSYLNKKFVFLAASAGQTRVKKGAWINEEVLDKFKNALMCGLSEELINELKGCNPNKYIAYLALQFSACDIWRDFDINKAIVVEDFETEVAAEYDYIDKDTMEITPNYFSKTGNKIKITHSDGCGMYLKKSDKDKAFQFRANWFKGLLVPVPYLDYCRVANKYKVTDIFGKKWNLLKDDIQYIFSRSQFKMAKYYTNDVDENDNIVKYGWDKYKEAFIKFNCKAGKLNIEPDTFPNKTLNYQMLQTLTDMKDDEIKRLTFKAKDKILKSYTDTKAMLDILGATKDNDKMTAEQQCLAEYPELLRDYHFKSSLEDAIASMKRDAKAGTLKVKSATTFIVPDVLAWMQYLIGKEENPTGFLKEKQVFCKLFDARKYPKLACLRSPHLYREWAIMDNVNTNSIWLCTNALYVNCHDLLSKVIMNDWDGDESLIVADQELISVASRNMKGVNPLYYEMQTAESKMINKENIWSGIESAWKYGNIGIYSNKLTKLWNNPNPNLKTAAVICFLNNSSIDAAKTNYMPKVKDKDLKEELSAIEKSKLPYFFQFCKDYNSAQVAPRGNSTMDRICKEIESIDYDFENDKERKNTYEYGNDIGRFSYKTLLKNKDIKKSEVYVEYGDKIIEKYILLNEKKNYDFKKAIDKDKYELEEDSKSSYVIYKYCMDELKSICPEVSVEDLCDIIASYVFTVEKANKKTMLFNLFGEILLANIRANIAKPLDEDYIKCCDCGTRVKKQSNRQKRCPSCSAKATAKRNRNRKNKSA